MTKSTTRNAALHFIQCPKASTVRPLRKSNFVIYLDIKHEAVTKAIPKMTTTRAKGTKYLLRNVLSILGFKQFTKLKGRNGMQKKRLQSKGVQIKTTLNVKIN